MIRCLPGRARCSAPPLPAAAATSLTVCRLPLRGCLPCSLAGHHAPAHLWAEPCHSAVADARGIWGEAGWPAPSAAPVPCGCRLFLLPGFCTHARSVAAVQFHLAPPACFFPGRRGAVPPHQHHHPVPGAGGLPPCLPAHQPEHATCCTAHAAHCRPYHPRRRIAVGSGDGCAAALGGWR